MNSIELGPATGVLTRSGSVPSLDLKSFLPSSQEDEQQIENMHQVRHNFHLSMQLDK